MSSLHTQKLDIDTPEYVLVPKEKLTPEALSRLMDAFILREGTDYGFHEATLEEKQNQIQKQLDTQEILIVFHLLDESVSLIKKSDLPKKAHHE